MTNKEVVLKFYEEVFNGWDESRIDEYMHEDYKQHTSGVADGREGFKAFFKEFVKCHPHMDICLIVAEDDIVMVYFKVTNDSGIGKVCDIYRLRDGKLAEHWDVTKPLDPNFVPLHQNGEF